MIKYYTRACNFYYGNLSKKLVKKKQSLPLCGNKNISFDQIEIFSKNKKKPTPRTIEKGWGGGGGALVQVTFLRGGG